MSRKASTRCVDKRCRRPAEHGGVHIGSDGHGGSCWWEDSETAPGPFLNITTADGELIERIDLTGVDLSKRLAGADLLNDIRAALAKAGVTP